MPCHSRTGRPAARRRACAHRPGRRAREISLALVEDVAVGDYVIVHVGYALSRLDTDEAERTLALFAEAGYGPGARRPDEIRRRVPRRRAAANGSPPPSAPRSSRRAITPSWSSAAATTHAISRYGITDLLPATCAWSTAPAARCACCRSGHGHGHFAGPRAPEVILCSYGDCLRVPASAGCRCTRRGRAAPTSHGVFGRRRARPRHAPIRIARWSFFAIGFETTTPPTALVVLRQAAALGLANFSVICNHVLAAGHRGDSTILDRPRCAGSAPCRWTVSSARRMCPRHRQPPYAASPQYRKPVVIAGFEPLDVMQAIRMLIRQVNEGRAEVENEFTRAVVADRQPQGPGLVAETFELRAQFQNGAAWASHTRRCASAPPSLCGTRGGEVRPRLPPWRTTRPASAARSCAGEEAHRLGSSAPYARRRTRWARAWCRPKAPARRTTAMAAFDIAVTTAGSLDA